MNHGANQGKKITNQGFTLVELLIVVALIGLILATAISGTSNYFRISLNSGAREIASLVKEAYNSAAMTGKVHRLVFDLDKQQFWVESGPSTSLLDTTESKEKEARRKKFGKTEEPSKPSFNIEKSITRKPQTLPRGIEFQDVITSQSKDPITSGTVYTHIFPHGFSEQTVVHLKDSSRHELSLAVEALLGRSTVFDRYVKEDEAYEATPNK